MYGRANLICFGYVFSVIIESVHELVRGVHSNLFSKLAQSTLDGLFRCPCELGRYTCVQTPQCGGKNQHLDKAGALYFLQALLGRS